MTETTNGVAQDISKDEIALYDRQIRLWGLEAQRKMIKSKILLINLTSVGTEIAKNVMLAGIGGLTIIDDSRVLEEDLNVNFFIEKSQVGQYKVEAASPRIQGLNPRVKLETYTSDWESQDVDWFKQFTVIIATGIPKEAVLKINEISRGFNIPLYTSSCHGLYGYIFVDLIEHDSNVKKEKGNISRKIGKINNVSEYIQVTEVTENDDQVFENSIIRNHYVNFKSIYENKKLKESFTSVKKLKKVSPILPISLALLEYPEIKNGQSIETISVDKEDLREKALKICEQLDLPEDLILSNSDLVEKLARQAFTEFQPVSAIVGGALSQDVINTLGKRENPINNFLVLDGVKAEMPIYIL